MSLWSFGIDCNVYVECILGLYSTIYIKGSLPLKITENKNIKYHSDML